MKKSVIDVGISWDELYGNPVKSSVNEGIVHCQMLLPVPVFQVSKEMGELTEQLDGLKVPRYTNLRGQSTHRSARWV